MLVYLGLGREDNLGHFAPIGQSCNEDVIAEHLYFRCLLERNDALKLWGEGCAQLLSKGLDPPSDAPSAPF